MSCLAKIDGRDAVPVRAIPYITGWNWSPLDVARQLARTDGPPFSVLDDVFAYHGQGRAPTRMLPKEWDAVRVGLEALEVRIRAKQQRDESGYAEWRLLSVPLLPEGVFLFKDEFEKGWARQYQIPEAADKREGDRELNYEPLIPAAMRGLVMAGFEKDLLDDWVSREARQKAVSKAPRPPIPLGGVGGIAPRDQARQRPQPDWSFWRLREYVQNWEAAALSLGIDPDSMEHNPYAWMAGAGSKASFHKQSFRSAQEEVEFDKRYRLVIDWVRQRGDRVRLHNTGEVLLTGFASWVVENGLPSNPEFESFAEAHGGRSDKPRGTPATITKAEPTDFETSLVNAKNKATPFVERKDLVAGFGGDKEWWDNRFKSLSRNTPRWLAHAMVDKKRGPTGAHLFNPAVVALGLLQQNVRTKSELLKAMRSNEKFAPFVEQFKLALDTDTAD